MAKESTELTSSSESSESTSDVGYLISIAIEKDLAIEKLEKLLQLRREFEDREAEKAFHRAKSKFQADVPDIPHDKDAETPSASWRYASLGMIVRTISTVLGENGLSFRWEEEPVDNAGELPNKLRCILTHQDGHSESATFSLSIDGQQGALSKMTMQHRQGAADTYAKSRTLKAVLGIGTADDDTDGLGAAQPQGEPITKRANILMADWLKARHELADKPRQERIRQFGLWFTAATGEEFSPILSRWSEEQYAACVAQLSKERQAANANLEQEGE